MLQLLKTSWMFAVLGCALAIPAIALGVGDQGEIGTRPVESHTKLVVGTMNKNMP
jgi:hypothetical protein